MNEQLPYLDSNVFIFAVLDVEVRGENARKILKAIVQGENKAVTSALTVDEVVWKLWRLGGSRENAIKEGRRLIELDSLDIIALDRAIIRESLDLMDNHKGLSPRDALHLATALKQKCTSIITDDAEFDKNMGIQRKGLSEK